MKDCISEISHPCIVMMKRIELLLFDDSILDDELFMHDIMFYQ